LISAARGIILTHGGGRVVVVRRQLGHEALVVQVEEVVDVGAAGRAREGLVVAGVLEEEVDEELPAVPHAGDDVVELLDDEEWDLVLQQEQVAPDEREAPADVAERVGDLVVPLEEELEDEAAVEEEHPDEVVGAEGRPLAVARARGAPGT